MVEEDLQHRLLAEVAGVRARAGDHLGPVGLYVIEERPATQTIGYVVLLCQMGDLRFRLRPVKERRVIAQGTEGITPVVWVRHRLGCATHHEVGL